MTTVNVIVADQGKYGWSVASPQLPELVGGRQTHDELMFDLDEILRFGGMAPGDDLVFVQEIRRDGPNGEELVFRVRQDHHALSRVHAVQAVLTLLSNGETRFLSPESPTGEHIYVAGVPADRLDTLTAQYRANERALIAYLPIDIPSAKPGRRSVLPYTAEMVRRTEPGESSFSGHVTLGEALLSSPEGRDTTKVRQLDVVAA